VCIAWMEARVAFFFPIVFVAPSDEREKDKTQSDDSRQQPPAPPFSLNGDSASLGARAKWVEWAEWGGGVYSRLYG
jgi:hypothetical protein